MTFSWFGRIHTYRMLVGCFLIGWAAQPTDPGLRSIPAQACPEKSRFFHQVLIVTMNPNPSKAMFYLIAVRKK